MRHAFRLALLALLLAALVGCSNDDKGNNPGPQNTNSTTWDEAGQFWKATINASSSTTYAYYSFTTRDVVTLTDEQAKTATNWDVAFKRVFIKTNSGVSGPNDTKGIDLVTLGLVDKDEFSDVTAATIANVQAQSWFSDGYDFALDSIWNYNFQTHQLLPSQYVYVLSDATGHMVKFQITGILDGVAPPAMGKVIFRYVYQPDENSNAFDLPEVVDTVGPLAAGASVYYSFSQGNVVTPGSPTTSVEWDIKLSAYDVYLNNSIFGPGEVAAFAVYDGLTTKSSWDELTDLSEFGSIRWVTDQEQSIFTATEWYDYISGPGHTNPTLLSKRHTYVIQAAGKNYKVEIVSYYDPDTQASGTYTINWAEI